MAQHAAGLVQQHIDRMDGLDGRIRTLEGQMAGIVADHTRVMDALFNGDDGEHGLVAFMTSMKAQIRLLMVLVAIVGAIAALTGAVTGVMVYLEGSRQIHNGIIKIPHLYAPAPLGQVYAKSETAPQVHRQCAQRTESQ